MAQRRMFSPDIVHSDAFLEMPPSTQALYFQLGMKADDDGFVNPKTVMRMIGSSEDELKVLLTKRFVLPFESGVLVIKHWKINNLVRKDWYRPTRYLEEKSTLFLKENGSYTTDSSKGQRLVNEPLTQVRLGKVSNNKIDKSILSFQGNEIQRVSGPENEDRKEKAPPKNKIALKLMYAFSDGAEKAVGTRPVVGKAEYTMVCRALENLTEQQITDLFDEWFNLGRPDEDTISIRKALSNHQIEQYKIRNHI